MILFVDQFTNKILVFVVAQIEFYRKSVISGTGYGLPLITGYGRKSAAEHGVNGHGRGGARQ
jgi:hypothetical protein